MGVMTSRIRIKMSRIRIGMSSICVRMSRIGILAIGNFVRGPEQQLVKVTWKQVHPKTPCDIVSLYTKGTKIAVTDSHRITKERDEVTEASLLKKGDEVWVTTGSGNVGKESLQSVTKHRRNIQVAQVEFEHDATVLCFPERNGVSPPCTRTCSCGGPP